MGGKQPRSIHVTSTLDDAFSWSRPTFSYSIAKMKMEQGWWDGFGMSE